MRNEVFLRFFGGAEKALTFSYDDGTAADIRLIDLFNKYGLKSTFNLNSGCFDSSEHGRLSEKDMLKVFARTSHEISAHGHKHLFLTQLNTACGIDEVLTNKKYLEQHYGKLVEGFAYPYGKFNSQIKKYLELLGFQYARTAAETHSFDLPNDFMELNPTAHHNDPDLMDLADKFIDTYPHQNRKNRNPYLFFVYGHSYEFDDNGNWHVMENFAKRVCGKQDVWYATNIEAVRYIKAFNSLAYSADGSIVYNPSCLDIWIECCGAVKCVPFGQTVKLNDK